ncbi:MAG: AAA family ATPase [Candidatus Parvarchaeota archaeon]|nr:AAA family ATPase [Candidatus Parvarchaeota archaeon]
MLKLPENRLEEFIENYPGKTRREFTSLVESGQNKFIFEGPSGTGKSFLASAFAESTGMHFEVINLYLLDSVDDSKQSDLILNTIMNEARSKSLFESKNKVLFIEDLDKVLSVDPKILGKLREVNSAIIIFESRNGESFTYKGRSQLAGYKVIRFYKPNERVLRAFAYKVLALNRVNLQERLVDKIIKNARGNFSSVVTDINTAVYIGKDIEIVPRNSQDTLFERLNSIFSGDTAGINTHFSSDLEAKAFEIWLSDKVPSVFSGQALHAAFDRLSASDILLNKIRKQNWVLLRYIQEMLFNGIGALSMHKPINIIYYAPNWNVYYKN